MSRLPIVDARTMEKILLQLGFVRTSLPHQEQQQRLEEFLEPFLPLMGRRERQHWGLFYVQGLAPAPAGGGGSPGSRSDCVIMIVKALRQRLIDGSYAELAGNCGST